MSNKYIADANIHIENVAHRQIERESCHFTWIQKYIDHHQVPGDDKTHVIVSDHFQLYGCDEGVPIVEDLTVYFRKAGNKVTDVYLEGPAELVYEGRV